jgi:hypothetical protein
MDGYCNLNKKNLKNENEEAWRPGGMFGVYPVPAVCGGDGYDRPFLHAVSLRVSGLVVYEGFSCSGCS